MTDSHAIPAAVRMRTMGRRLLTMGFLLCCAPFVARSQDAKTSKAAPVATNAHELALQLSVILNRSGNQVSESFAESGGASEPALAKALRRATVAHTMKYLPMDTLVAIGAREYERSFSEAELRELVRFYASPLGSRFLAQQVQLSTIVRAASAKILAEHQAELAETFQQLMSNPPP